jgi:hypothetical protein
MRRETCGGCGSATLEPFLDLGETPLADAFPMTADEPETWYPLDVAVCTKCWLVQLLEVVPDSELYGSDYAFYSGTSPSLVEYLGAYAADVLAHEWLGQQAQQLTVEIAANDGTLLRHFADAGCRTLGVEPANGPADAARGIGLDMVGEPFTAAVADNIRGQHGPAGLIIANHVLAHVSDLDDFLNGVDILLDDRGAAIFEFHYLPDLLVGNQWDHFYHEHRFYFSLTALDPLLRRHGLRLYRSQRVPREGGSMRVTVCRGNPDYFVPSGAEAWLWNRDAYTTTQARVDHVRDDILAAIRGLQGTRLAGYAASAKSTTLLNYCGLEPSRVKYVVDTTPHKIGRVTPGTGIPVVAPGDRPDPDVYLLLSWNYLPGVLRRERQFIDGGGRFLVPIPTPVIL